MAGNQQALSVKRGANFGLLGGCIRTLFGFLFCSAFFGIGCMFLWLTALDPLLHIQRASSWKEFPCLITKSAVEGHETFRLVVEYDYEFNGETYHGDRFDFFNMATNGKAAKLAAVRKYPVGQPAVCFVDPANPTEAVIDRSLNSNLWFGLIPLPFIFIGLGGYWFIFIGQQRLTGKSSVLSQGGPEDNAFDSSSRSQDYTALVAERVASQNSWSNSNYDEDDLYETPGAITLKTDSSPFGIAIMLLLFATFWNGIVSLFVLDKLDNWMKLKIGFEELFLVPFVLVGIGLILAVLYNLMATLNPKPILILSRQLIPLGGSAELQWNFPGGAGSIRVLKLMLKGVESATYRRGTNTNTDEEVFCEKILFETSDPLELTAGSVEVFIPSNAMHSFDGGNNKVIWQLQLKGEIPMWPDVSSKFPIRVVPHE